MKSIPLRLAIAGLLSVGASTSALAQSWYPNSTTAQPQYGTPSSVNPQDQAAYDAQQQQYQDAQQRYQDQQQQYQNQRGAYDSRTQTWQARRDAYDASRAQYSDDRDAYEQQRADYDAQYGAGSWERRYGYGASSSNSYRGGYDYYRSSPCERRASSNAAAGGVIGALAGAAIGSSVAGRGNHTTGAILGGVAGAAIGSAAASSSARCDTTGYYFTYDDTYAYRVADNDRYAGRYGYDYYVGHRCRLAIAPAYTDGSTEDRYVRVCPDGAGRYRITP